MFAWLRSSAQSRQFNYIPNGTGLVRIADVLVSLLGDMNRDGYVDVADVQALTAALADLQHYKAAQHLAEAELLAIGDLDNSGAVNNLDLQSLISLLANNASGGVSLTAVPKPASIILLLFGAVALVAVKRLIPLCRRIECSYCSFCTCCHCKPKRSRYLRNRSASLVCFLPRGAEKSRRPASDKLRALRQAKIVSAS